MKPVRVGEKSSPLKDGAILVGGDVPNPWEDVGDRKGDGDRFCTAELEEKEATGKQSRLVASSLASACSALTTSANDMKLKRRTSTGSGALCVDVASSPSSDCNRPSSKKEDDRECSVVMLPETFVAAG